MTGLQVLLPAAPDGPMAAGLPISVRNADSARVLSPAKMIFAPGDAAFKKRWSRQLKGLPVAPGTEPDGDAPLLVISGDGLAEHSALKAFLDRAVKEDRPLRWLCGGKTAAEYYPQARRRSQEAEAFESPEGWRPAREAEAALFAKLPQETDGFVARMDRKVSMALSRRLIQTPITPNQITTLSLLLGLLGSWWLAAGGYPVQVAGALLLWSCCILDGCDGEVARLKLLCSPGGALYDVIADNIVHVAIFVAIPFNVRRNHPEGAHLLPGLLLVSGFLACMFSVWWLVLRRPKEERGEAGLFVERMASRDFIYLILALTAIGKLEWFLWAAAVGSHVFNLALWVMIRRAPTSPASPSLPPAS